jgi:hypothetical protein
MCRMCEILLLIAIMFMLGCYVSILESFASIGYTIKIMLKFDSKINEMERSRGFALSHLAVSRLLLIALEMNLSSVVYD